MEVFSSPNWYLAVLTPQLASQTVGRPSCDLQSSHARTDLVLASVSLFISPESRLRLIGLLLQFQDFFAKLCCAFPDITVQLSCVMKKAALPAHGVKHWYLLRSVVLEVELWSPSENSRPEQLHDCTIAEERGGKDALEGVRKLRVSGILTTLLDLNPNSIVMFGDAMRIDVPLPILPPFVLWAIV